MSRTGRIGLFLVLSGMIFCPFVVHAQKYQKEVKPTRIMWTQRPNAHSGLFTARNHFVAPGFSLNVSMLYYFGDVENEGTTVSGGLNGSNVSAGAALTYQYPLSTHCNLRVGAMVGFLHANNEGKLVTRTDYRKFESIVIQPFIGVQYYPFSQAGFYLYGGVGVTASIITKYDFVVYGSDPPEHLSGSTFGILPQAQIGLGYSWVLSTSWSLSLEAMVQPGFCDEYYMNLDAYPLAAAQSSSGQAYGTGGQWYYDINHERQHKWIDGWFQVGVTITYQWRNCETCQIINNYGGIRPRKR